MTAFKTRLKEQLGYLTDRDMKDAQRELGRNYEVVVKTGYGERHRVALKNIDHFEKDLQDDYVRAIFIPASEYKRMFKEQA